jgi:peroxiredoxin Q/BCP
VNVLDVGVPMPSFSLPDQDGRLFSSASLRGRWCLLWWYPKAGTPACTVEGQELRDHAEEFAARGCAVVGLSFDTPEDNHTWALEQGFGFPLLSDVDHATARRFEAERDGDDQYADFPLRVSYLVDPDGIIRKTYAVSGVTSHATSVLETLSELEPR